MSRKVLADWTTACGHRAHILESITGSLELTIAVDSRNQLWGKMSSDPEVKELNVDVCNRILSDFDPRFSMETKDLWFLGYRVYESMRFGEAKQMLEQLSEDVMVAGVEGYVIGHV